MHLDRKYNFFVAAFLRMLVALDFDGTLWDSVGECYRLTCDTFAELKWPLDPTPTLEKRFRRGRFFVRNGDEFYLLMIWLLEHPDRDPISMTFTEAASLRAIREGRAEFEACFYRLRERRRLNDFKSWSALQHPYPGVVEEVKTLQEKFYRVVVATTKDADSAKRLLAEEGLLLDVVGREITVNKAEQIQFLSQTYDKPPHQILFVDDLLDQLLSVQATGAQVALAGWGYESEAGKAKALQLGIPVLELHQLVEGLLKLNGEQ